MFLFVLMHLINWFAVHSVLIGKYPVEMVMYCLQLMRTSRSQNLFHHRYSITGRTLMEV